MDAISRYKDAVVMYAQGFAEDKDREADDAVALVEGYEYMLEEHMNMKPIAGNPSEEWEKEKERIERALNESEEVFERVCESWRGGEKNPKAIKYAKSCVEKYHPELHEQYQEIVELLLPDLIEACKNMIEK